MHSLPGSQTSTRTLCAALDKYRLPRAIVHVENRSFVAWNRAFLSLTGFSDDQLWSLNAKDWITLGNPVAEAPALSPVLCGPRILKGS
jgi:hypothetical protein